VSTKIIIIPRASDGLRDCDDIFTRFLHSLDSHKDLIDHPLFCAFICVADLALWLDEYIGRELSIIREIERGTGHGAWVTTGEQNSRMNTEELVDLSRRTGASLAALANVTRHVRIAETVFKDLESALKSGVGPHSSSINKIAEAVTLLRRQVDSAELYASYLQERARAQQSVVNTPPTPSSLYGHF